MRTFIFSFDSDADKVVAFLASSGKETIPNFENYFMVFYYSLFWWVR